MPNLPQDIANGAKAVAHSPLGALSLGSEAAGGDFSNLSASNILGLPQLSNLRDLMVRVVKVAGGMMLLFAGLNMLAKQEINVDIAGAVKSAARVG